MADLPRYSIGAQRNYYRDPLLMIDPAPDGDWVKWGDVSARLQQLEQEKASLQESCDSHADHAEEHFRNWERLVIRNAELKEEKAARNLKAIEAEAENTSLRAALAETRDALHQLTEEKDELQERIRHFNESE